MANRNKNKLTNNEPQNITEETSITLNKKQPG